MVLIGHCSRSQRNGFNMSQQSISAAHMFTCDQSPDILYALYTAPRASRHFRAPKMLEDAIWDSSVGRP